MKQVKSFQDIIFALQQFWTKQGCVIMQAYDVEVGAGTFHPATALRALGPSPWKTAYVQPSRRPKDGRYGENPNRLQQHHQFQVILKPSPNNLQDLYIDSLAHIGIDFNEHDIRFIEGDWESPTLGAWGLGWEVWCDGMEISQFTYMQQIGGIECELIAGELTYGLERLCMYIQGVDNVYDLEWNGAEGEDRVTYGDVFLQSEQEFSAYCLDFANTTKLLVDFNNLEEECDSLISHNVPLPAYDCCLKASHIFNLLDARGVISVTERASYIGRVRAMARKCCSLWLSKRYSADSFCSGQ